MVAEFGLGKRKRQGQRGGGTVKRERGERERGERERREKEARRQKNFSSSRDKLHHKTNENRLQSPPATNPGTSTRNAPQYLVSTE
jgi:hypothetical protein